MRTDIYGGLRNALQRGVPLEQAIRSFINAGYNEAEVREVAKQFSDGALSITAPVTIPTKTPTLKVPESQEAPSIQNVKRRGSKKVIFLIIFLIILVGILISTIFFKDKIIEFLSSLV
ncbi:MAG: hypothetical protein IIA87_04025 [Nanoarchaeota archaeon]|nr:hypothetical protein [Nanoarchaeota archaeon]